MFILNNEKKAQKTSFTTFSYLGRFRLVFSQIFGQSQNLAWCKKAYVLTILKTFAFLTLGKMLPLNLKKTIFIGYIYLMGPRLEILKYLIQF